MPATNEGFDRKPYEYTSKFIVKRVLAEHRVAPGEAGGGTQLFFDA